MSCEWCYVPFGTPRASEHQVMSIVDQLGKLGFKWLTIGGGDPFQYSFIPNILQHANSRKFFVHVDTHGKSLYQTTSNLELITDTIDLLGLPLDGSNSLVHDHMRDAKGHFDLVCRRITWLSSLRYRLKINTVISSQNAHDIESLARLVSSIDPIRWSIYQYWPLGSAAAVVGKHDINDSDFLACSEKARNSTTNKNIIIEVNSRNSRRDTYPIVHHDGEVFVHSPFPHDNFISLGSIFAPNAHTTICSACTVERSQAESRYLVYSTRRKSTQSSD